MNKIYKKPQKFLGPSQLAIVLNLSPFDNPISLQNKIEQGYWQIVNERMNFGITFEKTALEYYQIITNYKIERAKWKTLNYNPKIGGFADGLIYNSDGTLSHGVEIKCHPNKKEPLDEIPKYYLVQIIAYMAMYQAEKWDLMSICFDENNNICDYKIHQVNWNDYKDIWENDWYPKISSFIDSINWSS